MEFLTDFLLSTLFISYSIYSKIVYILAWIFMPVTKWYVDKKFKELGLEVNGKRPIDPKVLDDKFYLRIATDWELGAMEAIVDKQFHVDDPVAMLEHLMATKKLLKLLAHPLTRIFQWFNLQTPSKAFEVGAEHYDLDDDIWDVMLDKNRQYSCGYWKDAKNLEEAQLAKMDLIARKLKLQPGMKVLDIGCGWGGLARFLAKNYKVTVVGYTISKGQKEYCDKRSREEGLPVEVRLADYRTINEKFDRAVSVGMFEHVGVKNYKIFFETINRCLKDDGLFLFHTMGINPTQGGHNVLWIHKYIFRNGYLPYEYEVAKAIENLFIIEDWHNFGYDYYRTIAAWQKNFIKCWPQLEGKYGDKFYRIWTLYLQTFQALFKSRTALLWQIVLSKDGVKGGYESIR